MARSCPKKRSSCTGNSFGFTTEAAEGHQAQNSPPCHQAKRPFDEVAPEPPLRRHHFHLLADHLLHVGRKPWTRRLRPRATAPLPFSIARGPPRRRQPGRVPLPCPSGLSSKSARLRARPLVLQRRRSRHELPPALCTAPPLVSPLSVHARTLARSANARDFSTAPATVVESGSTDPREVDLTPAAPRWISSRPPRERIRLELDLPSAAKWISLSPPLKPRHTAAPTRTCAR